jgi:hypothetical protein
MNKDAGVDRRGLLTVKQEVAPAKYRGLVIASFQTWVSLGMP